ncbi:PD-(D/E)XK nuclease family protein [Tautonia rosea]|uniref:PD-(D/E)XK nuclease family protein n=1 Tax=Tautonia rosea TaxID=2728037 RepID=UPI0014754ED6|nr:PD-(D/E)XK nuclease family protein [Tautonia rosea]
MKQKQRPGSWYVTASEITTFACCPEQWRLQQGLGLPPVNREHLARGDAHHERLAAAERRAGRGIGAGRMLIALAWLVLLGLFLERLLSK